MHKKPGLQAVWVQRNTHLKGKRGIARHIADPDLNGSFILTSEVGFCRLLMIVRLATRDIFHFLKLLYKMFCVALEDQTNRRDVPHTSR